MNIEKEIGYIMEVEDCYYTLDITYFSNHIKVNDDEEKIILIIHSVLLSGQEIKPILKIEILESIRTFLFKKKNNIPYD